jgi:SOS-response transcriptional repressor LexA
MVLMATNPDVAAELRRIRESVRMSLTSFADALGVERHNYRNWEYGTSKKVPEEVIRKARSIGARGDVGPFAIPAAQLLIPIPYIGLVSASDPPEYTDPFASEDFEYVPPEMGDAKGRFALRVLGDSMYDLLFPNDLCVFQASPVERIGCVILHRTLDNLLTIKTLKHDGTNFILHAENRAYEPQIAKGSVVGYLVGIVREQGSRRVTVFDGQGIRP